MPSKKASKGAYPKISVQHNLSMTARNCNACNEPDSIDDQVECEKCLMWYHFRCAQVDETIRNHSFVCAKCAAQIPVTTSSCRSGKSSTSSARAIRMQIEFQRMEEEKLLREKALRLQLEEEKIMQDKENALQEKILRQERELREKERQEKQSIEAEHLAKRFDIMLSMAEEEHDNKSSKSRVTCRSGVSKVKQWLTTQQSTTTETVFGSKTTPIVVPSTNKGIATNVSGMQQINLSISPLPMNAIIGNEVPDFDISDAQVRAMVQPAQEQSTQLQPRVQPGISKQSSDRGVTTACPAGSVAMSDQGIQHLLQRDVCKPCLQPLLGDTVAGMERHQPPISRAVRPPPPMYNRHVQQDDGEVMPLQQAGKTPYLIGTQTLPRGMYSDRNKNTAGKTVITLITRTLAVKIWNNSSPFYHLLNQ